MHICYIAIDYHNGASGGGIASYTAAVGKELVRCGHRVTVIAQGKRHAEEDDGSVRVVRIPLGNLHWYAYKLHAPSLAILPLRELEWSRDIRHAVDRVMGEDPIDVIEGQETGILFLTAASKLPPVVVRFHGDAYTFNQAAGQPNPLGNRVDRWMQRVAWRLADTLSAPSHAQAGVIATDLHIDPESIHVVPNPIDPWFLTRGRPAGLPTRSAKLRVLYTGRVQWIKGTLTLIAAVPQVLARYPEVEFVIAGGTHPSITSQMLQHALRAHNAERAVSLLGHVQRERLPDLYREADVFVMPSYYESFGISVLEAMASGLPVVASSAGALSELIDDGVTGLLAPPGDPDALAGAIGRLLGDPDLRARLGSAAREKVSSQFSAATVAQHVLALYAQCLESQTVLLPAGAERSTPSSSPSRYG